MSYDREAGYGDAKDPSSETREDRDIRLERRYVFDRGADDDLSVGAIVSRDREELAHAFMAWYRENRNGEDWTTCLPRWEAMRFGAMLEPSAHGMLRFAVRRLQAPGAEGPVVPKRPVMPPAERQRRFDEAVGKAAREKAWPGAAEPATDGR